MGFGDAFAAAWKQAKEGARQAAGALATGAANVGNWVADEASEAAQWTKEKAEQAAEWTEKKAKETAEWVENKSNEVKEWSRQKYNQAKDWTREKAEQAVDWAKDKAEDAAEYAKTKADDVKKAYEAAKDYVLPQKVGETTAHCQITGDKDDKLIEVALNSDNPEAKKLADQLKELNHVEEMAWLAKDVYNIDSADAPPGWTKVSADPDKLAELGLKPDDFAPERIGFKSALYEKDGKYVLSIKGTESKEDWIHNGIQGLGLEDEYYKHSIELAKKLKKKKKIADNLEITGHSLGGGLATAAGVATGMKTTVFNPAGVHPNTFKDYDVENADIDVYQLEGEILTTLQENREAIVPRITTTVGSLGGPKGAGGGYLLGRKLLKDGAMPAATGHIHKLPASEKGVHHQWKLAEKLGYNPAEGVEMHSMDSVLHSVQDRQSMIRQNLNALLPKN